MSDAQFTKLFKQLEKGFANVEMRFDKQDDEFADLKGAVAELDRQIHDYSNVIFILTFFCIAC